MEAEPRLWFCAASTESSALLRGQHLRFERHESTAAPPPGPQAKSKTSLTWPRRTVFFVSSPSAAGHMKGGLKTISARRRATESPRIQQDHQPVPPRLPNVFSGPPSGLVSQATLQPFQGLSVAQGQQSALACSGEELQTASAHPLSHCLPFAW